MKNASKAVTTPAFGKIRPEAFPFAKEFLDFLAKRPEMTTLDIALVSRKPHPEVMRDVRLILSELGSSATGVRETSINDEDGLPLNILILESALARFVLTKPDYFPELMEVMLMAIEKLNPKMMDDIHTEAVTILSKIQRH